MEQTSAKTTVLILAALLSAACTGTVPVTDGSPDESVPIFFDTSADAATRALIEPGNFNTPGNRITVYDTWTPDGGEPELYMDAAAAEYTGSSWDYTPVRYWTKTGVHSFLAFTSEYSTDGGRSFISLPDNLEITYGTSTGDLAVRNWKITLENQFDFMYARHTRSMAETNPHRPVGLQMEHLLSAIRFNITNLIPQDDISTTDIYFTGIEIKGASDTGDAVISESEEGSSVDMDLGVSGDAVLVREDGAPVPLYYGQAHNILSGHGNIGEDGCFLIWPHDSGRLGNVTATIRYTRNGVSNETELDLDSGTSTWRAGRKYIYNIEIQDNSISFSVEVVDWIYDDVAIEE